MSMNRYADELEAALRQVGCEAHSFVLRPPWRRLPGRWNALANYAWRSWAYPRAARRHGATHRGDVNHILDHSYGHLVEVLDAERTVVTCHDAAPLASAARGLGLSLRLWRRSFAAMQQAARIVAVSEFVRGEVARHSNYPAGKTTVIECGVSAEFRRVQPRPAIEALRQRHAPGGKRLLLHVGSCLPVKNVEAILSALPFLADLDPVFVQVGGRFSRAQRQLIESLGVADRVRQPGPAFGDALAAWYQAADVLVFPSRYEGFGLPVLEAMACGTPVACAEAGALPEVAGGAAALFDPNDAQALAGAVRASLTDKERRRAMAERGWARSREFTWEETARRTLEVYRDVAAARAAG